MSNIISFEELKEKKYESKNTSAIKKTSEDNSDSIPQFEIDDVFN